MNLGGIGIWIGSRVWRGQETALIGQVADIEALGFGTVWVGGAQGDLELVERLLRATRRISVATGIVNIWTNPSDGLNEASARLLDEFSERLVVGIGSGHRARRPDDAVLGFAPYRGLVDYLDVLDAGPIPVSMRLIGALGPRLLRLSTQRAAGAHPFLVVPEHTRQARQTLGDGAVLAPEQAVAFTDDPRRARAWARAGIGGHLAMDNYRNSLRRQGFESADLDDGGSDALVDALVAWGESAAVVGRLREHRAAGADHVAVQFYTGDNTIPIRQWRALAETLGEPTAF